MKTSALLHPRGFSLYWLIRRAVAGFCAGCARENTPSLAGLAVEVNVSQGLIFTQMNAIPLIAQSEIPPDGLEICPIKFASEQVLTSEKPIAKTRAINALLHIFQWNMQESCMELSCPST